MKDKYDVIIIGAGLGGLVCGCLLAKKGLRILIIEKNKAVGGCASSININGFNFDMGAHLVGGCNGNGLFRHILQKLNVGVDFIRLRPSERIRFKDRIWEIPNNLSEYMANLEQAFPAEKNNISPFFDELIKIYESSLSAKNDYLNKYESFTYQEFLKHYFKNKELQSVLSGQCIYAGLPPNRVSVIVMSYIMVSYLRDGIYYTKGGTQNLCNKIAEEIVKYSGHILCNSRANRIITERNVVKGVILNKNSFIEGRMVISNIDAETTFLTMIGEDSLPSSFTKKIKGLKKSTSLFHMHLALDMKDDDLEKIDGWYYNGYDINSGFQNARYIFIPSLIDKYVAPKNRTIVNILKIFDYHGDSIEKYQELKNDIEATLLQWLKKIIGLDIKKNIIMKIITGPKEIENFTGNSSGAAYGWAMSPDQIMNNRLNNVTPFLNLFLAGHWTSPGCGLLGVAASGMATGQKILKIINEKI